MTGPDPCPDPDCAAQDLTVLEQHAPACPFGKLLAQEGLEAVASWLTLSDRLDAMPDVPVGIDVIQSPILCRHCDHAVCNFCALNGFCKECGMEYDQQTLDRVQAWFAAHG